MKITNLETTVVSVPPKESREIAALISPRPRATTVVLVQASTDEGITGLGEAPDVIGAEVTKMIIDSAKSLVLAEDPFGIEVLMKRLYAHYNLTHLHIQAANWALIGIEMALWDILGKACQKPLYQLWGGAFRREIPFYGSIRRSSPEDITRQAESLLKRGFKTLYAKVGFGLEEDLECVRIMREAAGDDGDIKIRIDANQSWMPGEAIKIINQMAQYDLEFVDQPVLMYNLDALARVRRGVSVPIASHESSWTFYSVLDVMKRDAADVIHIDPRFDAGFTGARKSAAIAEAAGIPVVEHSFSELGVAVASFLHLIASCPNFIYANQQSYDRLADDVIKGGKMEFREGCLELPEGPGIGVELDMDKVAKYAAYYERNVKGKEFVRPALTPQYMLMSFRRFFGY